jgi:cardiolipin synthase
MGQSLYNLQCHFLVNWNSSKENKLSVNTTLFPPIGNSKETTEQIYSQIVAGRPIYPLSNIMLTHFKIFTLPKNKLYFTNPYFIPSDSLLDALKQTAISGVDVRLMIPEKPDSMVLGAASKFFYREILEAGV